MKTYVIANINLLTQPFYVEFLKNSQIFTEEQIEEMLPWIANRGYEAIEHKSL